MLELLGELALDLIKAQLGENRAEEQFAMILLEEVLVVQEELRRFIPEESMRVKIFLEALMVEIVEVSHFPMKK